MDWTVNWTGGLEIDRIGLTYMLFCKLIKFMHLSILLPTMSCVSPSLKLHPMELSLASPVHHSLDTCTPIIQVLSLINFIDALRPPYTMLHCSSNN